MQNVSISVPLSSAGLVLLKSFTAEVAKLVSAGPAAAADPVSAAAAAGTVAVPGTAAKGKPGRKSNAELAAAAAAAAPSAPAAASAADLDLDLGGGDQTADSGDELGLDDVAPPAAKLTLAGDVIPAFRAALERVKGDKSKLAKVLEAYGVKSVQLLPEAKWPEVVAVLAKLK